MRKQVWVEERLVPLQEEKEEGIALLQQIQKADELVLRFIHQHFRCKFLNATMPWASFIGNAGAVWGVAMAFLLLKPLYRQMGFVLFGILALCGFMTNFVLKPLVARPRPCHRNSEHQLLVNRPQDYSFPSGHSMSSFAAAMVIYSANQTWGLLAFGLAALIAFSRMYLYVHYPSDVLSGIIIGLLCRKPVVWICVILLALLYFGVRKRKSKVKSE